MQDLARLEVLQHAANDAVLRHGVADDVDLPDVSDRLFLQFVMDDDFAGPIRDFGDAFDDFRLIAAPADVGLQIVHIGRDDAVVVVIALF